MRSGQLKDRITIQQKAVSRGAMGKEVVTWTDLATVWAQFEPLRGREYFSAKQEQAETNARFWMRYRSDVAPEMRVSFRGKVYDIESVIDYRGQRRGLELMTREGVTNG